MPQNINKTLSKVTQAAFFFAVCLLSFFGAIEPTGIFGVVFILGAAAMNVLLALELDKLKTKLLLLLFVNILPFAAMIFYSGQLSTAILTLCPIALALPIYITVRTGLVRTASIAAAAIVVFVLYAVYYALIIYNEYGVLNIESIGTYIDEIFAPTANAIAKLTYEVNGEAVPLFTEQTIEQLIYYTKTMIIGSCAAVMIVFAYLATLAVRLLASVFGVSHQLPTGLRIHVRALMTEDGPKVEVFREPVQWRIGIDSVTVGVYIAAYIASVLLSPTDSNVSMIYLAVQNLVMILSPGFIYCGIRDVILMTRSKTPKGMLARVIPIFVLLFLFINPSLVVVLLCMIGVVVTIRENRAVKHAMKNRKE